MGGVELEPFRDELQNLDHSVAIEEGRYEPGLRAVDSLLSRLRGENEPAVHHPRPALWAGWPNSDEAGRLLKATAAAPQRLATRLHLSERLLGVRVPGETRLRFPPCQFFNNQVLSVVTQLLRILPPGSGSGWIRALWLYAPNADLSGRLPSDLLTEDSAGVLRSASGLKQPQSYLRSHMGW